MLRDQGKRLQFDDETYCSVGVAKNFQLLLIFENVFYNGYVVRAKASKRQEFFQIYGVSPDKAYSGLQKGNCLDFFEKFGNRHEEFEHMELKEEEIANFDLIKKTKPFSPGFPPNFTNITN